MFAVSSSSAWLEVCGGVGLMVVEAGSRLLLWMDEQMWMIEGSIEGSMEGRRGVGEILSGVRAAMSQWMRGLHASMTFSNESSFPYSASKALILAKVARIISGMDVPIRFIIPDAMKGGTGIQFHLVVMVERGVVVRDEIA